MIPRANGQMSYAVIGANWVVFGSLNGILGNMWAKLSLFGVLLGLATNIIGAWLLSELIRGRVDYGEADSQRWQEEFGTCATVNSPWPFTHPIDGIGRWMRVIKAVFTLAAGACFIIGVIVNSQAATS